MDEKTIAAYKNINRQQKVDIGSLYRKKLIEFLDKASDIYELESANKCIKILPYLPDEDNTVYVKMKIRGRWRKCFRGE